MHLRQLATGQDARQFFVFHPEQLPCHRTKDEQVVGVEIVPFVFAEPVKKDPAIRQSGGNNRAAAPTFPTPGERDALLEYASPQISVDEPVTHLGDGCTEDWIRQPYLAHPARERAGSKYADGRYHNTKCSSFRWEGHHLNYPIRRSQPPFDMRFTKNTRSRRREPEFLAVSADYSDRRAASKLAPTTTFTSPTSPLPHRVYRLRPTGADLRSDSGEVGAGRGVRFVQVEVAVHFHHHGGDARVLAVAAVLRQHRGHGLLQPRVVGVVPRA